MKRIQSIPIILAITIFFISCSNPSSNSDTISDSSEHKITITDTSKIYSTEYKKEDIDRLINDVLVNRLASSTDTLVHLSAIAVAPLITAIKKNPSSWHLIETIGRIGSPAKASIPLLIKIVEDKNSEVRIAAAEALGKIGPDTEEVIQALFQMLKQEDHWILSKEAASALGNVSNTNKNVSRILKDATTHNHFFVVRYNAAKALRKRNPHLSIKYKIVTSSKQAGLRGISYELARRIVEMGNMDLNIGAVPELASIAAGNNKDIPDENRIYCMTVLSQLERMGRQLFLP